MSDANLESGTRTCWSHSGDEWYFHLHNADGREPIDPPVARTVELGNRTVLLDYDEAGDVIGVEVL